MHSGWIPIAFVVAAFVPPALPFTARPDVVAQRAADPTSAIEIPLAPYAGALRTFKAKIGDFETPFLLDTGGGFTVLSTATAQRVGCTAFGRGTGFRHDGARVDGPRGTPVELSIGAFTRRGEVGVLDLEALLGGLPPVGGIASLETFAGQRISLDLAHDRLVVESSTSFAARTKSSRELTVRIARQAAGAALDMFVAIEGKHGPLWFEMDCGSLVPVLVAPHAFAELGLEAPPADKTRAVELPFAGFGAVKCEIASKEMIYDGVLNADFFLRHVVTFDLERGRAWLRENP